MSALKETYRQAVLKELHEAWLKNPTQDIRRAIKRVWKVMQAHDLKFNKPHGEDVDFLLWNLVHVPTDFFNRVNSPKYNRFGWFEWLCETYMDFEPVTRKTNEQLLELAQEAVYEVVALIGTAEQLLQDQFKKVA